MKVPKFIKIKASNICVPWNLLVDFYWYSLVNVGLKLRLMKLSLWHLIFFLLLHSQWERMFLTSKSNHIIRKSTQTRHNWRFNSVVKKVLQSDQKIFYDCIKIFSYLDAHKQLYTSTCTSRSSAIIMSYIRNVSLILAVVLLRGVRKTEIKKKLSN